MRFSHRIFTLAAIALLALPLAPVPTAAAAPVKLSGPMAQGYEVVSNSLKPTGDDSRAVFLASANTANINELFSTPINGGAQIKLNGPLVTDGRVINIVPSPVGNRVVYRADQEVRNRNELYSVPADGSAAPTKLTSVPVGSNGVSTFKISTDGTTVVFLQQRPPLVFPAEVVNDLYSVPITGGAAPVKINPNYADFAGVDTDFHIAELGPVDRVVWKADDDDNGISRLFSAEYNGNDLQLLSGILVAGGEVASFRMITASSRVIFRADKDIDETFELFTVPAAGGGVSKLNPNLAAGQDVEADYKIASSTSVVYRADQDVPGQIELYRVPIAGGLPIQLNPALAATRNVTAFETSTSRVAYIADQNTDGVNELYSVPILGGANTKLSGPMVAGGNVLQVKVGPDGTDAVYRADQTTDGVPELFTRKMDGSGSIVKLNPIITTGQVHSTYEFSTAGRVVFLVEQGNKTEIYSNGMLGVNLVKLNDTLVPGGTVEPFFSITSDSARVLYAANQSSTSLQAWSRSTSAISAGVLLSSGNAIGGDVDWFQFSADGNWVVYLASQDTFNTFDLYSRRVDGSGSPIKLNDSLTSNSDITHFQVSPTESKVVFMISNANGGLRIISRSIDGSDAPVLLNPPLGGGNFLSGCCTFSPDGIRIAFLLGPETTADLYSVPVAGGTPVKINGPVVVGGRVNSIIGFSPDSSRIVYGGDLTVSTQYELYSAPADGSAAAVKLNGALPLNGDVITDAKMTPDSQRVIYRADQDTNDIVEIYSVPITGGASTKLSGVIAAGGTVSSFQLTPNGATVTFTAVQGAGLRNQLYAVTSTGGLPVTLNSALVANGDVQNWKISPNGQRVVYRADATIDTVTELFSVPIDNSVPAVKLNPAFPVGQGVSFNFFIAPNSLEVVYSANQDTINIGEIYRVPIGGGVTTKLNGPLVAGREIEVFSIDPNGRRVVYSADQDEDDVYNLYAVPFGGTPVFSGPVKINGSLVAGGDVENFQINPKNGYVVYIADQDTQNVLELYATDLARVFDVSAPVVTLQVATGW